MCNCMNGYKSKKRRGVNGFSTNGLQSVAMNDVLPATIGYLAGEVLDKQLTLFAGNSNTGNIIKLAGGIFLAAQGGGLLTRMGIGLAANGAVGFGLPMLQKANIAGVNLLPPGSYAAKLSGFDAPNASNPIPNPTNAVPMGSNGVALM